MSAAITARQMLDDAQPNPNSVGIKVYNLLAADGWGPDDIGKFLKDYNASKKMNTAVVEETKPEVKPAAVSKPVEPAMPRTLAFNMFELYDPNNKDHRFQSRHTFDEFYFVERRIVEGDGQKMVDYKAKHNHYPIGVVERGEGIHTAYFPPTNSTVVEDVRWLNQASALRTWVDYDDALYADWMDPQPIAGELKPVQSFDPAWLPDAVRSFVTDISERMAVPVDFPAICSLVCLSGAVNHRAFVFPLAMDKDFAEPLCSSGAVIADSGKKKTPTWKLLMNPLTEWEFDQDRIYAQKKLAYDQDPYWVMKKEADNAVKAFNQDEKKLAKSEKRDPKFAQADYSQLPPRPMEPVKPRRLILNDSTPEQVHEIAKTNPQGLFYYRDELSGWAAELDMVGREGARSMFLQSMTGDHDHTVDRIGREGGHAKMTLSVFGSFQPHLFVNFFSETRNVADGTIPRFALLVWPDNTTLPVVDRQVNTVGKAMYRQVVRRLADLEDKSVSIHMSKEAQTLFHDFRVQLRERVNRESNPGKKSHLSKYEGGLAKIAALLQLVDEVAALPETTKVASVSLDKGETQNVQVVSPLPSNIHIDVEHFQRALSLLGYLESHMHRVYDSKLEGIEYRKARLLEHLKDGSFRDGMTANEVHHKDWAGLSRTTASADSILAALEELAESGWVRVIPIKPGTQGRPTKRWEINPAARGMSQ